MNREQIAQVAHEINRAYCASLGDASQPVWADAPEWQKASALAGVDMHLKNPDATPEQSHESWLAQKAADGWTFGEVKDAEKKQHPCFRPYDELPPEQKAKDYLFRATVHSLAALEAPAAAVQVEPGSSDKVAVKYIGKREYYVDGAYGTHIAFNQGETKLVPADKARLMLGHPDVYVPGELAQAVVTEAPKADATEEDDTQDMRDQVAQMDKDGLELFAKTHFKVDLDKRLGVAKLRAHVTQLVDQFGVK